MATLYFFGAAGTVTGSSSMVEVNGKRLLIDCGMFQGNKSVAELNDKPFPYDAKTIDHMVLTHAHIDHSGLIPKLVKQGFRGPIYATAPTADLLDFMLLDSATIQESEARRANQRRRRRGRKEIEPVYSKRDAEKALTLLKPVEYEEQFEIAKGIKARLWNAGHMLGSSSIELRIDKMGEKNPLRMLFFGDIGPEEKAFHPEPDAPQGYDYLICESTYGDRDRDDYTLEARREALKKDLVEGIILAYCSSTGISATLLFSSILRSPAKSPKCSCNTRMACRISTFLPKNSSATQAFASPSWRTTPRRSTKSGAARSSFRPAACARPDASSTTCATISGARTQRSCSLAIRRPAPWVPLFAAGRRMYAAS